MGVVYKARQVGLNRLVALKMILAGEHASAGEFDRFRTEAEAVARLQHPNVVAIHEVGVQSGLPYFSLEYCDGGSLSARLDGTPWEPAKAAALVETLARAMQAAHARGIVHRDLKPANILLSEDGTPKIADFGLAKQLDSAAGRTASGAILGTPSYMAPEQAGRSKDVGPAADVYALGAVLYELLTGRPPFKAATELDTVLQVVSDDPVTPTRLQPKTPRDLETICLKCLAKEPGRRYPAAEVLAEDLRRFRVGEPIAARPVSRLERGWRWCRRNRGVAALAAALLLALVTGTAVSAVLAVKAHWAAVAAGVSAADALASEQKAKAEALMALRRGYNARMLLAAQAWEANEVSRVLELLDSQLPEKTGGTDLRGFEWHYLTGAANQDMRTLRHHGPVTAMAVSPDGRWISSAGDNTVRLWAVYGGQEMRQFPGVSVSQLSFTPDGDRLVAVTSSGRDSGLRVWNVASGEEVAHLDAGGGSVYDVTADGRRAAVDVSISVPGKQRDNRVDIREVATGRTLLTVTRADIGGGLTNRPPAGKFSVRFSPDGRKLLVSSDNTRLALRDVASGATAWETEIAPLVSWNVVGRAIRQQIQDVTFSSDGRLIAAYGPGLMSVRDAETGAEAKDWAWTPSRFQVERYSRASFSLNGRLLAAADGDSKVSIWRLGDGKYREPLLILPNRGLITALTFNGFPSGGTLAVAHGAGDITLVDTLLGTELGELRGHTAGVSGLAYFSDRIRLASASDDGTVKVWNASAAENRPPFPRFSPMSNPSVPRPEVSVANRAIGFDATGKTLVATSSQEWVGAGQIDSRQPVRFPHRGGGARHLALHPSEPCVAVARFAPGAADDILLWDTSRGVERGAISAGVISALAFSPDGQFLAGIEHDPVQGPAPVMRRPVAARVRIWEFNSGREAGRLELPKPLTYGSDGAGAERLVLGPGARWLALLVDHDLQVWDVAARAMRWTRNGPADKCYFAGVALSPDGQSLAIGGSTEIVPSIGTGRGGQALEVWDVGAGRPVWQQYGPGEPLLGVALGHGQRLYTAGLDGMVRVWDVITREVVLTIRVGRPVHEIAVSRDGRLLGAALQTGHARIWDARTVTEESRREREAATALLQVVHDHLLKEDAVAALRADAALPDEVRRRALEWLALQPEDVSRLTQAARAIVRSPDQPPDRYEYALRLIEIAHRQAGYEFRVLNTLGVAQYRLGKYAEAAASLTRSAALNKEYEPGDFAFLAMAQYRLGKSEEARQSLARLRELVKNPRRLSPEIAADNKQFLAEAEALMDPPAAPKDDP
jgi:WD40 repeat protein